MVRLVGSRSGLGTPVDYTRAWASGLLIALLAFCGAWPGQAVLNFLSPFVGMPLERASE